MRQSSQFCSTLCSSVHKMPKFVVCQNSLQKHCVKGKGRKKSFATAIRSLLPKMCFAIRKQIEFAGDKGINSF